MTPKPITDEELEVHYAKFLEDVEGVQKQQKAVLRELKVKEVFVEGLTP